MFLEKEWIIVKKFLGDILDMRLKILYQKLLSENIRKQISIIRSLPRNYIIKRRVMRYLRRKYPDKEEISDIIMFLKNNPIQVFPYEFTKKYCKKEKVYVDSEGYKYINYNGKKLYGKERWDDEQFIKYYNMLLKEQDYRSPHCYFSTNNNRPKKDDIVVDIGGAEGIFSLSVIDDVKKIYIFEGDTEWIEPLRRTFSPWSYKVEIVEKYIGKEVGDNIITLDEFFLNKDVTFLKADIEGGKVICF